MKTNRRDASTLAKLHRAGELMPVWVPDAAHEAMRDRWSVKSGIGPRPPIRPTNRARATARRVLGKARQHLQGFLLRRHGRSYRGVRGWNKAYRGWLTTVRFDRPAQQIVLQDDIHTVEDAQARLERLERQIEELLPAWSMAPVVEAVQAMLSRFANPRQLMAYLGLVPSERSSGASVRRGGITKAGNAHARRVLIEGAWTYRMQARVSRKLLDGSSVCPRRSARSPGRRSCASAIVTAAWRRPANPRWS